MSYISNDDVELRLGTARYVQLTDDAGTGSANTQVVDEAREGGQGQVDSYLSQRYSVPIDLNTHAEVAGVLKSITLDLVEYRLHARRRDVPVDVITKRDAAIVWLQRVGRGETGLPSVAPIATNPASGVHAETTGDARLLSRDELSQF